MPVGVLGEEYAKEGKASHRGHGGHRGGIRFEKDFGE